MTDPRLVELARVAAGLTQGALARELDKTQPFISQVERGERDIPADLLPAWAEACGVPVSYFHRREGPLSDSVAGIVHRRMKTLPTKPFQLATANVKMISLELDSLFSEVDIVPALPIPEFPQGIGPTDAAEALRRAWGITPGPLPNFVDLVEAAGIPVVLLDTFHEKHSATSHRGRWFEWLIALNTNHPASRRRFTLPHDLGHIVLGHERAFPLDDADARCLEEEADSFAAALLMPKEDARRELRNLDFRRLVMLKQRWKVSIAFLIRQAFNHGLISDTQRQAFYIQLATQPGGRRREPAEFPEEQPTLIRRIITSLRDDGLSLAQIADIATAKEENLRHRYLGERLPLRSVQGSRARTVVDLTRL